VNPVGAYQLEFDRRMREKRILNERSIRLVGAEFCPFQREGLHGPLS